MARAAAGGGVADEEDGGRGFGFGRFDETALDFKVEEGFKLLEFLLRHVIKLACLELGSFPKLDRAVMVWAIWWQFIGRFVGEDGVGEVAEFLWDGIEPSFLVAGESSDSWVTGSCGSGGPNLGDVMVVFDGEVNLGSYAEAGDVLLMELLSAVFFGFDGCKDALTPPRKIGLFWVLAGSEGKRFLRSDFG